MTPRIKIHSHINIKNMKTGIELIAIERQEQIEKHSRTIERDLKENTNYKQLISAATALLLSVSSEEMALTLRPINWDAELWKKMMGKRVKDRLVIAAALIAAEIDRLNASVQDAH